MSVNASTQSEMPSRPNWWVLLIPVTAIVVILSTHSPHWVAFAGAVTLLSMVIFGLAKNLH